MGFALQVCSSHSFPVRTPNTGNTNNFYNVTATGTSNNNNATTSYGVLCGFPPFVASERQ